MRAQSGRSVKASDVDQDVLEGDDTRARARAIRPRRAAFVRRREYAICGQEYVVEANPTFPPGALCVRSPCPRPGSKVRTSWRPDALPSPLLR
jgi:hypothetical protein